MSLQRGLSPIIVCAGSPAQSPLANRSAGVVASPAVPPAFPELAVAPYAWYDFNDLTTMFTDAGTTPVANQDDKIYQINDKSASNLHLVQATESKRPLLDLAAVNGFNVAQFDHDAVRELYRDTANVAQPNTVFFVCHYANYSMLGNTGTTNRNQFYDSAAAGAYTPAIYAGTALSASAATSGAEGPYCFTLLFNGGSSYIRQDGVQVAAGNAGTQPLDGIRLGAYSLGVGYQSYMCEVLIFDQAISDTDRGNLEAYLMEKWGVA